MGPFRSTPMPHLEVKVGPDRFHMEPARLNDYLHPHEINTPHFCGRVLVRILDAPGAREGEPGQEYFADRSRKFCIQIEGRFKQEWSGDDIHFGTDFDKFVPFPRAPFNAGMHVARMIDPCTFYEEHPPSGRPYIMSPYVACMNVFCAWPAPNHMEDAVVVYRHTDGKGELEYTTNPATLEHQHDGDVVPVERLEHHPESPMTEKKHGWFSGLRRHTTHDERITDNYWRFVGFQTDPRVRAVLDSHFSSSRSSNSPVSMRSTMSPPPIEPSSQPAPVAAPQPTPVAAPQPTPVAAPKPTPVAAPKPMVANKPEPSHTQPPAPTRTGTPSVGKRLASKSQKLWHGIDKNMLVTLGSSSKHAGVTVDRDHVDRPTTPKLPDFDSSTLHHEADWSDPSSQSAAPAPSLAAANLSSPPGTAPVASPVAAVSGMSPIATAPVAARPVAPPAASPQDSLSHSMESMHVSPTQGEQTVEQQLGPWRFADPGADMVEDNAFVFLNESVSVPHRRKHFADVKNRKDFKYDPNVVYGASFFSNLMNFNTFDLAIGPVRINVSPFFQEMPIRYSLRAKGSEELTFCTISFQLVN